MLPSVSRRFCRRIAVLGTLASLAACTTAPAGSAVPAYVIFFTPFSASLEKPALEVISDAARAASGAPGRTVTVIGYADRAGSPEANVTLSRLRAQVVADGLAAKGVARSRLITVARGSVGNEPGLESRRVAIELN